MVFDYSPFCAENAQIKDGFPCGNIVFLLVSMSKKKSNSEERSQFENPIDPDKVAENPHSLEYGHHVGSAAIKAEDVGKQKGRALTAMEHQTDQQLSQLYEQMKLLADQAKKINQRKAISERIYEANFRFDPIINHIYYLYQDLDGSHILSIIAPNEWGRSRKNEYTYLAQVRLLADHTWDIMDTSDDAGLGEVNE